MITISSGPTVGLPPSRGIIENSLIVLKFCAAHSGVTNQIVFGKSIYSFAITFKTVLGVAEGVAGGVDVFEEVGVSVIVGFGVLLLVAVV